MTSEFFIGLVLGGIGGAAGTVFAIGCAVLAFLVLVDKWDDWS